LAAGCSVVLKPAPETPLSALALADLAQEAGIPPGVLNVVPGGDEAGRALVRHPQVPKIAFTGQTESGIEVMTHAAPFLKRITLELGGKSPQVVFEDVDLDEVVSGALFGVYLYSGQVCQAGSRVLVQDTIYSSFVEKLTARTQASSVGNGKDFGTDLGPIISLSQKQRVLSYIEQGTKEGAVLMTGGKALEGPGFFVEPTIFSDVKPGMAIAQEEIFGPVLSVIPFHDEEEALDLANGTRYGLAAGIWTRDVKRAMRLTRRIKAGTIWLNTYQILSPTAPFGGYKHSGIGRELGPDALEAYLETKTVIVDGNEQSLSFF
jgi:aldehyde dehydrogenase (NAD+)